MMSHDSDGSSGGRVGTGNGTCDSIISGNLARLYPVNEGEPYCDTVSITILYQ